MYKLFTFQKIKTKFFITDSTKENMISLIYTTILQPPYLYI